MDQKCQMMWDKDLGRWAYVSCLQLFTSIFSKIVKGPGNKISPKNVFQAFQNSWILLSWNVGFLIGCLYVVPNGISVGFHSWKSTTEIKHEWNVWNCMVANKYMVGPIPPGTIRVIRQLYMSYTWVICQLYPMQRFIVESTIIIDREAGRFCTW